MDVDEETQYKLAFLVIAWGKKVEFPPWFKLGTATSAYQVEGAWNSSDKSESIWDRFLHNRVGLDNGDVATDSYRLWQRDVEMLAEVGVDFYRFSISWTRVLPRGYSNYISEDGVKYYSDLIDALLEQGIEPVVTIYHWDLPQMFQDKGGWTNPLVSDWFADYARVVFSLFGDRVKTWITINEPVSMCDLAYNRGSLAPGIADPGHSNYLCTKHVLLAHARAWRVYDEEFKSFYGGKVSICNNVVWLMPHSEEDKELTNLVLEQINGRFFHPIYSKEGGWPPALEKIIEENSLKEGYPRSRLPPFTEEEIKLIQGTYDYSAINYYTSRIVRAGKPGEQISSLIIEGSVELNAVLEISPYWEQQYADIMPLYPEGLRSVLAWITEKYCDIEIFVTECGYSTLGAMDDDDRNRFIDLHLEQILLSIDKDRVNITGFTYWSLMDSLEWIFGYDMTFGLFHVDYSSPDLTRTPRSSAKHYSSIIRNRYLELP